jgi:hypothetical protein
LADHRGQLYAAEFAAITGFRRRVRQFCRVESVSSLDETLVSHETGRRSARVRKLLAAFLRGTFRGSQNRSRPVPCAEAGAAPP